VTTGTTIWTTAAQQQLALLLLAGQLVASYGWPGTALAAAPRRAKAALARAFAVPVLFAVALLPGVGPWTLAAAALVGVVQTLIWIARRGTVRSLGTLLADQALLLVVLAAAWFILTRAPRATWSPIGGAAAAWTRWAAALGVLALVLRGGVTVTALLLARFPGLPFDPDTARMGRTIGVLERALVLLLVVLDQWGAVGLVVAAKSLARFEDLKRRHFAEYYLIGTLASLLLACLGGLVLRGLLRP